MKRVRIRELACGLSVLTGVAVLPAQAQTVPTPTASPSTEVQQVREELAALRAEFDRLRRAYDERLMALEQRLAQLGGGPSVLSSFVLDAPAGADADVPAVPPAPEAEQRLPPSSSQVFNPDTSVIGNVLAVAGENPASDDPPLSLDEVEVAFQAIVDPYARADVYIAAGQDGVEVEEGFITMTALPGNLLLKAGKLRAQFGKMNTLHTHRVPGADRPLVSQNLLGGHDGFSDSGFSLSHLVQNPALFVELTGEMYAGTSPVFQSSERSTLTYLGRVRAYRDLTEATNLDLGASFAFGPGGPGELHEHGAGEDGDLHAGEPEDELAGAVGLDKRLFGFDATLRYRPLRGNPYRRLNLRTELIWSRQDLPGGDHTTAFGFYGLGEYQLARRWYVGGRIDRSARLFDGTAVDTGGAAFVTFWATEYNQIRGQYRRINFHEGSSANELLLQLSFSIGAHGAHVF